MLKTKLHNEHKIRNPQIDRIEKTEDTLTGRGGLVLFVRYLSTIGIYPLMERAFGSLRKSRKGISISNLLKQLFCFFMDGTSFHLTRFDDLKRDEGYRGVIENREEDTASSHAMKRFFKSFSFVLIWHFRRVLQKLFIWRLKIVKPDVIILGLDTMVMDNNDALKREGVEYTYKRVKGFQPLQLFWRGFPIDAVFRGGSKHSNNSDTAIKMIKHIVKRIRREYNEKALILVRMDSGFFDGKNFEKFEEMKIGYICGGRLYADIKEKVKEKTLKEYRKEGSIWDYTEFMDKREKWDKERRLIYTQCHNEDNQLLLPFAHRKKVFYTNLGVDEEVKEAFKKKGNQEYLTAKKLIEIYHLRGKDELSHRGIKDFGTEQLPFLRFEPNSVFYYTMLISFFLFETFKEDVIKDVAQSIEVSVDENSYARTFRRYLIDFAAKIVYTGREIILKVTGALWERIKIPKLWERCNSPPVVSLA